MRKSHLGKIKDKKTFTGHSVGKKVTFHGKTEEAGNLICGSCGKRTKTLYSKDHEMMCWECQK